MNAGPAEAISQLDTVIRELDPRPLNTAIRVDGKVTNLVLDNVTSIGFSSLLSVGPEGYIENAYMREVKAYAPEPVPGRATEILAELRWIRSVLSDMQNGEHRAMDLSKAAGLTRKWGPALLSVLPAVVSALSPWIR